MRRFRFIKFVFYILLLFIALNACNNNDSTTSYQPEFAADTSKENIIVMGFPSFSYSETAEPFIKFLNKKLPGIHVKMKACVSYNEYLDLLHNNAFDITLINGFKALDAADNGYTIVGKIADDDAYSGVVFTRKDAAIENVNDLKGKRISLASFKMLPGTMMPLYYLYEHGLDVNYSISRVNTSSFESAIIAAYVGKSEAGLCLKRSWNVYVKNHPEVLSKVEVKWETTPLIHNALLIKSTLDSGISNRLVNLFFSIHNTAEGKEVLKKMDITHFEKANNNTYKPMLEFKKKYDSVIHINTEK